jgi:hypothetical protein
VICVKEILNITRIIELRIDEKPIDKTINKFNDKDDLVEQFYRRILEGI